MLGVVSRILGYRMTIAEWIGTALLLGAPYLAIGILWALTHTERVVHTGGLPTVMSIVGNVVFWPVLFLAQVCLP